MGKIDKPLFFSGLSLIILGFLILESASMPIAMKIGEKDGLYFLKHQFLYGFLPGVFLSAIIFFKVDFEKLKKINFFLLILNLILLCAVLFFPVGKEKRGVKRWVEIFGVSFQPSEFIKPIFVIYLSSWLEKRRKKNLTFVFFIFILFFLSLLLFLQPDVSTLGILIFVSLSLFFLANTPLWQNLLIFLLGILFFPPVIQMAPYRMKRLLAFFNPDFDTLGITFHLKQAEMGLGAGKIFGRGFGFSLQKFGKLPNPFSDSIFAVFGEETGFLGCLVLIFLYFVFVWRGFWIGIRKRDSFLKLTAFGISLWIFFQTFINIGSMVGILPLTGVPLPFVSYGGSHLISEIVGFGILLKISIEK